MGQKTLSQIIQGEVTQRLWECRGHVTNACRSLDISRKTIYRWLLKWDVDPNQIKQATREAGRESRIPSDPDSVGQSSSRESGMAARFPDR